MTYLPDLHSYLHQSSLLIQAYPTTRITTKYSLPRRKPSNPNSKRSQKATTSQTPSSTTTTATTSQPTKEKREPAATLTLKTYHPSSGICLKYRTDKAQEVGRLLAGLGRLARGEVIELPATSTTAAGTTNAGAGDKMDVDDVPPTPAMGSEGIVKDGKADVVGKSAAEMTVATGGNASTGSGGGSGGGKKKKKGGKR